jgi:hypothetical protein
MTELREELKGKDMALKAEGVLKMCYVSCCLFVAFALPRNSAYSPS